MTIPDGQGPIATWDATDPLNSQPDVPHWLETTEWAQAHIPRVNDTWKVEFYDTQPPTAVVHRFAVNEAGRKFAKAPDGQPATEDPVIITLDELPPAHLLRQD